MAETTTSWPLNAEVRSGSLLRSTLRLFAALLGTFVEFFLWTAVTVKPALLRAMRILEPRLPVAWV